jgi:hypothetical protein
VLFDPTTRHLSPGPPLPQPLLAQQALALPGGDILVVGGDGAALLRSATLRWEAVAAPTPITFPYPSYLPEPPLLVVLADGRVLATGGDRNGRHVGAELFDPAERSWRRVADMRLPRERHSATLLPDGRVLVAGGGLGENLGTAEIFDPSSEKWTLLER